ncbi:MAG: nucleotidyltransferase [Firmicutes bacterium]|nr:nucleotidyltransferase [Bacillota bacterium]
MESCKAVGIIAEYNPFHNGHKWHLHQSQAMTGAQVSVAVMSGSFTQRGEFAMADKWLRAKMAVENGMDLVVELPVIFGCNSAGYFASAGVEVLENLGVDWISFGCEGEDMTALKVLGDKLSERHREIEKEIRRLTKEGISYPRARQEALTALTHVTEEELALLHSPNSILALEYLKHIKSSKPLMIPRRGPGYYEAGYEQEFASASWLRDQIALGQDISQWLPDETGKLLKTHLLDKQRDCWNLEKMKERFFHMVAQQAFIMSGEDLDRMAAGGEGLGNKIKREIRRCSNLEELIDALKSKRYTQTRIQRFLAHILLGITKETVEEAVLYARVLAFNETGSRYLKQVKKSGCCKIPIITNINKETALYPDIKKTLEKDILAADLFNLAGNQNLYENCDLVRAPINFLKGLENSHICVYNG